MIEKTYKSSSRDTKKLINQKLIKLGYTSKEYQSEKLTQYLTREVLIYEGKQPGQGALILEFHDLGQGAHWDDYRYTEINAIFLLLGETQVKTLENHIENSLVAIGEEEEN